MIHGLRLIEDEHLTVSGMYPRSPARAARRARKGYRQHFATRPDPAYYQMGEAIIAHPATMASLKAQFAKFSRS